MSRNSKNARLVKEAKARNRPNGFKGPAKTSPKHGKQNAWWQKFPSYSAFVRGNKKPARKQADTAVAEGV